MAGYEALARFDDPSVPNVEAWFRTAHELGMADQLEAAALASALRVRSGLPVNCFLSVNVSPHLLAAPAVQQVLDGEGPLGGVIIELTEHTAIDSYAEVEGALNRYRAAGALVAVDDAGSGYAGLKHLLDLRPSMIKLDRHFVDGIDRDPAKRVMAEMLGTFADRTDCWLLAEGVERPEELALIASLGVPLAQGYLLGRPADPWAEVPDEVVVQLADLSSRPTDTIRARLETGLSASSMAEAERLLAVNDSLELVVIVDERSRPTGVARLDCLLLGISAEMQKVHLDTSVRQALQRALVRPRHSRFDPLVATDAAGRFAGIVRIESLIQEIL